MKEIEGLHAIIGGLEKNRICELARIAEAEGAAVVQLREKLGELTGREIEQSGVCIGVPVAGSSWQGNSPCGKIAA